MLLLSFATKVEQCYGSGAGVCTDTGGDSVYHECFNAEPLTYHVGHELSISLAVTVRNEYNIVLIIADVLGHVVY